MFNAVGGSTIHWSAHFPRYHPSDFRVRSLDGVGDDWPLDLRGARAVLRPERPDGRRRRAGRRPVAAAALGPPDAAAADRAARARRWRAGSSGSAGTGGPPTAPSSPRRYGEPPACNHCGPCDLGCPIGARSSADVTYWPLALAARRRAADPLPRARDHRRRAGPGARRALLRRRRPAAASSARRCVIVAATASARRACCSTRARGTSRTAWPTGAGWSART